MPFSRSSLLARVKGVEREHSAARLAMDRLLETVQNDPTQLANDVNVRDVTSASVLLEATYLVRLFAEFEAALRSFWHVSRGNPPPSRTRDLVESIGVRRRIPVDYLANAHSVREYRNSLVHEGESDASKIALPKARSYLCHFLSFLPVEW